MCRLQELARICTRPNPKAPCGYRHDENLAISGCHEPDFRIGITAATCHAPTHARVLRWQGDVVVWRKVFFEEKNMSELETFRAETRAWLEENCPAPCGPHARARNAVGRTRCIIPQSGHQSLDGQYGLTRLDGTDMAGRIWRWRAVQGRKQNSAGRACPHQSRPALTSFGLMLGPALLEFASEEQKKNISVKSSAAKSAGVRVIRSRRRFRSGGLQTKAEDKGDHYLVNGQKVWTSYADQCDWIFCLVRTDNLVKHDGISFC